MTDRARPGLVALYDIWPGNGAGQFLQPRSPHGAFEFKKSKVMIRGYGYDVVRRRPFASPTNALSVQFF